MSQAQIAHLKLLGEGSLDELKDTLSSPKVRVAGIMHGMELGTAGMHNRNDGLKILRTLPNRGHLPVHWGMSMAVYPFFGAVAETVGRLLKLQETISAAQVQRRVREQLGQRETVARAARRTLRCLIDWEVLKDTEQKGVYRAAPKLELPATQLKSWLIEGLLISKESSALPLKGIMDMPALFPFRSNGITPREIESNRRLRLFRHGLHEDMVMLRDY